MKPRLISMLLILTVSCTTKKPDWQTLDFGPFKLETPGGWTEIVEKGIDSYVGRLTNGKDTLSFDYGMYSAEVGEEDPQKHMFALDTINGLVATVAIPITPGHGYIRMSIPINSEIKFCIGGRNIQSTDTILKIFKSIIFEESDTTVNSVLTISKFKTHLPVTGKSIFKERCGGCHSINRTLTGPALTDVMQNKSTDWLFKFLTQREQFANDTTHLKLMETFNNLECMKFPDITKEEIKLIVDYIKSY